MSKDVTENARRSLQAELNAAALSRELLEIKYGTVWNTDQLTAEFDVIGFLAPFIVVKRRADSVKGTLAFQHSPRFYFDFRQE